jgi:glutamyl-tRNA synthetase
VLRVDDLDAARYRMEYSQAMLEDLRWMGFAWDEGPDVGGPHAPYLQSQRRELYRAALAHLHEARLIYPCSRSRRDIVGAAGAPHEDGEDEPVYPAAFRPDAGAPLPPLGDVVSVNWRLRVPDGEELLFEDTRLGTQRAVAGRDFGDFPVWRRDDCPSYQLACAVDDALMGITEVVRGEDLVRSTFRQLLVYRALGRRPPLFHHCALMKDEKGVRLAKRHDALSLRALRDGGKTPGALVAEWRSSL